MVKFLAKRLGALVVTLIMLTAVLFVLEKISGVNLAAAYLGRNGSTAQMSKVSRQLGLQQSLPIQYLHYLDDLVHGNLQVSLSTHRPVRVDLGQYLPPTIELVFFALLFAVVAGLALGMISALRWPGAGLLRVVMVSGAAAPSFLLALLGIIVFYHVLGWLPATGQFSLSSSPSGPTHFLVLDCIIHGNMPALVDALRHLVLPSVCLGIGPAVAIGRTLRGSLLAIMGSDHVRTARAKGLGERTVVLRHCLRNASNAAAQMTGLQIGYMFGGVVIVEQTFAWPGVGNYTAQAIASSDFPAIIGVSLVVGALFIILNAAVDIVQALADPRIALG